jgi:hypothetical protein
MEAGFLNVRIELKTYSKKLISGWFPGNRAEDYVASADIHAVKTGSKIPEPPG